MHNPYSNGDPREIIERLRVMRGFPSARALAIAAGVNQPTLSRYLSRVTETMDVTNFVALAKVLEVTLSELLGEVPLSSGARIKALIDLMEELPEPQRDALLAAGRAMAQSSKRSQ